MEPFTRLARFAVLRDAMFVALASTTLMTALSFHPQLALTVGAGCALGHAVVLVLRTRRVTVAGLERCEPWRALPAAERAIVAQRADDARWHLVQVRFACARVSAGTSAVLAAASLVAGLP